MHALLGLGASHLTAISEGNYHAAAIRHRILAIQGFNEALSTMPSQDLDDDALLGASYALSFQSSCMRDGAMPREFITMLRGCGFVSTQVIARKTKTHFTLTPEDHYKFVMPRLRNLPTIEKELYEGAGVSLKLLEIRTSGDINRFFFSSLLEIVSGLRDSTLQGQQASWLIPQTSTHDYRIGYLKYISLYQALANLPQEPFNQFVSPANNIAPFLLAHLFGLQVILTPALSRTWGERKNLNPIRHRMEWIQDLHDSLDAQEQKFLGWPVGMASRARAEMDGKIEGTRRI